VIRLGEGEVPKTDKTPAQAVADMLAGRDVFPKVAEVFNGLQADYFPFRIDGDCLYGVNRTPTGWWLWCFNNRGVIKFADRAETVDPSQATAVRVTSAVGPFGSVRELMTERSVPVKDGVLAWTVPAGDLAVFDIQMSGNNKR